MNRLITAATITIFLLTACGGGETESSASNSATKVNGVTDTEIVIGTHGDLSGPVALLGTSAVNGARMRFEYYVGDGGEMLKRPVRTSERWSGDPPTLTMLPRDR